MRILILAVGIWLSAFGAFGAGIAVRAENNGSDFSNLATTLTNIVSVKTRFGIVGNGVADDTVAAQNALNAKGELWFPPGTYLVSTLIATNDTHIYGVGARFVLKAGTTNAVIDATGATNNFKIEGVTFDGQDYSDITSRAFGTRHGLLVNAGAQNCSASINVLGFNGYGVRVTSTFPGSGAGNIHQRATFQLLNMVCQSNYCGIAMISPDNNTVGEYVTVLNPDCANNRIGIIANAGNHKVIGGKLTDNNVGAQLDAGSANAHHGAFIGVSINHNISFGMTLTNVANGELIKDCYLLANGSGIWLASANGVTIENCFIQVGVISWSGGSNNRFVNNMYGGVWGGSFNFTALDNSFVYYGNWSEDNAGDTDGHFNMDYAGNTTFANKITSPTINITGTGGIGLATNSTAPNNTSIIRSWVSVTNAAGVVLKMPLYQ